MTDSVCPACGYAAPETDGPTHVYMSPSAPCWEMYGEVLAREFSDIGFYRSHRLLTDAYCAHHPIADERRARQSINIHLASLMLHFEDSAPTEHIIAFLKAAAGSRDFPFLEQPAAARTITIEAIHAATNDVEHAAEVEKYASAVFDVWSDHNSTIRALIESVKS